MVEFDSTILGKQGYEVKQADDWLIEPLACNNCSNENITKFQQSSRSKCPQSPVCRYTNISACGLAYVKAYFVDGVEKGLS